MFDQLKLPPYIWKYIRGLSQEENGDYCLVVQGTKKVTIGDAAALQKFGPVQVTVADKTGVWIPHCTPSQWTGVLQYLFERREADKKAAK